MAQIPRTPLARRALAVYSSVAAGTILVSGSGTPRFDGNARPRSRQPLRGGIPDESRWLDDVLRARGPLSLSRSKALGVRICAALFAALEKRPAQSRAA